MIELLLSSLYFWSWYQVYLSSTFDPLGSFSRTDSYFHLYFHQNWLLFFIYIFIRIDYYVILQDRWIEWVFLFYIWTGLPIFRWKKDAVRTFFVWFLSDLCPFQLRLLYYHFPSFPRDWKVIDQQFTTFQLFKKWQNTELCCLWYLIPN